MAISGHFQFELDEVAVRLNQPPRKTSGFETPQSLCVMQVWFTNSARPTRRTLGFVCLSVKGENICHAFVGIRYGYMIGVAG